MYYPNRNNQKDMLGLFAGAGKLGNCKPGGWKAAMTIVDWKALIATFDKRTPMRNADRTVSMSILYWICDRYRIKSPKSFVGLFPSIQRVVRKHVGQYMYSNDSKEVLKYLDSFLVPRFKLQPPNMAGKKLIFCVSTIIVSLAVADGAFAAKNLYSARNVHSIHKKKPAQYISLRWKPDWLMRPIFRHFSASGPSSTRPLQYRKLKNDMAQQSLDYGCEEAQVQRVQLDDAAQRHDGGGGGGSGTEDGTDDDSEPEFDKTEVGLDIPGRAELARLLCSQPENSSFGDLLECYIQARDCMVAPFR
ncbi:hypothetical protein BDY21DRAFT_363056 [Lineolata rhizophorae]|uniref:Uncharacterized protein n=1 Tax=Lineolata rhizophorae TaxID=578093 RepID=A0A6A6P2R1_9PEZI|nr:hypothetical protein BDY21DRAFT_363056 [Lineolata rhizophorae]